MLGKTAWTLLALLPRRRRDEARGRLPSTASGCGRGAEQLSLMGRSCAGRRAGGLVCRGSLRGSRRQRAVHIVFIDITETKRRSGSCATARTSSGTSSSVGRGMSLTQPDGGLRVNDAFCRMLGYAREELDSRTWQAISHPDDAADTQRHVDELLSGAVDHVRFVKRYLRKDGTVVWGDVGHESAPRRGRRPGVLHDRRGRHHRAAARHRGAARTRGASALSHRPDPDGELDPGCGTQVHDVSRRRVEDARTGAGRGAGHARGRVPRRSDPAGAPWGRHARASAGRRLLRLRAAGRRPHVRHHAGPAPRCEGRDRRSDRRRLRRHSEKAAEKARPRQSVD